MPEPRILVAEDDAPTARILEFALAAEGQIHIARDGLEALRAARELIPHLVLTDMQMPGIDGVELCRRLRSDPETSHIPIVIMSATDEPDRARCEAEAFLSKPFDIRIAIDTIHGLLAASRR